MTIRGSQVIPVYPLTEDIQPGDVFLVQLPIDQQQKLYQQNGFLPLLAPWATAPAAEAKPVPEKTEGKAAEAKA